MTRSEQIIENNKIFAEFMGMRLEDYHGDLAVFEPMDRIYTKVGDLGFDRDWNKLMRVVTKIESMKDEHGNNFKFPIEGDEAIITDGYDQYVAYNLNYDGKFKAVYGAALKFIKSRKDAQKDK